MLNETRFGYLYHGSVRLGMNTRLRSAHDLPRSVWSAARWAVFPTFNFSSYASIGDYGGSERGKQFTRQFIDNLTLIRGSHTFKTGINFANFRISSPPGAFGLLTGVAQNAGFGRFDFNGRFTIDGSGHAAGTRRCRFPVGLSRIPLTARLLRP